MKNVHIYLNVLVATFVVVIMIGGIAALADEQSLVDRPVSDLCTSALNGAKKDWEKNQSYAAAVEEAKRRDLNVDDCRVAIGMKRLPDESAQQEQEQAVAPAPSVPVNATIVGLVAKITDGDTFAIGDTEIRTCGIDTPETGRPGAAEATSALRVLVKDQVVGCIPVGNGTVCDRRSERRNQGRTVAQCFVGNIDMGDFLVERGFACDWAKFSGGYYSRNGGKRCLSN